MAEGEVNVVDTGMSTRNGNLFYVLLTPGSRNQIATMFWSFIERSIHYLVGEVADIRMLQSERWEANKEDDNCEYVFYTR